MSNPYRIKTPLGYANDPKEVALVNLVIEALWPIPVKKVQPHQIHDAAYSIIESDQFEQVYWELYEKPYKLSNQFARKIRSAAAKAGYNQMSGPKSWPTNIKH